MVGTVRIVDGVSSFLSSRASFDLSADPCFPIVRSQGQQGSCSSWATTYYQNGFIQAKEHGWTGASTGNNDQLLSPAFTYNKWNHGDDHGSSIWKNSKLLHTVGVCRWNEMPYDYTDDISWGDENAWRDAPMYRIEYPSFFQNPPFDDTDVNTVKTNLNNGLPVVFAINASSYDNFGVDDVLSLSAMEDGLNHAQAIIGYDDSKSDVETGEIGAFKIVNSWGASWGPNSNGYYWMTYEAFKGGWQTSYVSWYDDLYKVSDNTNPILLGVWQFNPTPDRDASVELGIGPHNNPDDTRAPEWDGHTHVMHFYPEFMCLDITEFYDEWISGTSDFYLDIGDAVGNDGTITSFKVEYYRKDGYIPGNPSKISDESPDTPKVTPDYVTVSFPHSSLPVHNVDKDIYYGVIQEAIYYADSGDTIEVSANNIYYENVVIDKSLNLIGEDRDTTVIDGGGNGAVVYISADWVNVSRFTITGKSVNECAGIELDRVQNCYIANNNISKNLLGIKLTNSEYNNITNNKYGNNGIAIFIGGSHNNVIYKNNATTESPHLFNMHNSDYNQLINNNFINGPLLIYSSSYTQLTNNSMFNDGIGMSGNSLENWNTHTIDATNTVNGKPVHYLKNTTGISVPLGVGQVILGNCTNITIKNQTISNTMWGITLGFSCYNHIENNILTNNTGGIYMDYSHYNNITNNDANFNGWVGIRICQSDNNNLMQNNFTDNTQSGLYIPYSDNNTYNENTISNNRNGFSIFNSNNNTLHHNNISHHSHYGIHFSSSSNNNISGNTIISNNQYGINLTSSSNDNVIYNNYFNNNAVNAYDYTNQGNNTWNITKTLGTNIIGGPYLGGNYWSDYNGTDIDGDGLGDTNLPYNCSGDIQNGGDWLPLLPDTTPPEIMDVFATPSSTSQGGDINITCTVEDNIEMDTVNVTITGPVGFDPVNVSMDEGSYYYNRSYDIAGTYEYFIWANDISGNANTSITYFFVIEDTTPPEITDVVASPSSTSQGGNINITCSVTDNIDVDAVNVSITGPVGFDPVNTTMNEGSYHYNASYTIAGSYNYFIWANDTSRNYNTSIPQPFNLPLNADVDENGKVHFMDLVAVARRYNDEGPPGWIREDVDNGGKVHFMDLVSIARKYNEEW